MLRIIVMLADKVASTFIQYRFNMMSLLSFSTFSCSRNQSPSTILLCRSRFVSERRWPMNLRYHWGFLLPVAAPGVVRVICTPTFSREICPSLSPWQPSVLSQPLVSYTLALIWDTTFQRAYDVEVTSFQHRCKVIALYYHWYDVVRRHGSDGINLHRSITHTHIHKSRCLK